MESPASSHEDDQRLPALADRIFAGDLSGKSVLDVEPRDGYFCREALRRGAVEAVGFYRDANAARPGGDRGPAPDFRHFDFWQDEMDRAFDYVVCLDVLQYLAHPLAAIDRLAKATREKLILEFAGIGPKERRKLGLARLKALLLRTEPVLYVSSTHRSDGQNWFATPAAVSNLLLRQRAMFSGVEFLPSPRKDGFIAVAHKRQIRRLILIAGPTSAGKSTLIEQLVNHQAAAVAERLQLADVSAWQASGVRQVGRSKTVQFDQLLLHYDFLGRLEWSTNRYRSTEVDDVLQAARDIVTLTIFRSPEQLQRQFEASEVATYVKRRGTEPTSKKHRQLREDYKSAGKVLEYYKRWFDYLRRVPGEHLVADFTGEVQFLCIDEWYHKYGAAACGRVGAGPS
jgi:hypothetical protein